MASYVPILVVGVGGSGPNYAPETFITPGGTHGDDYLGRPALSLCHSSYLILSLPFYSLSQQCPLEAPETRRVIPADHILHARHLRLRDHKGNCEHTIFLIERPPYTHILLTVRHLSYIGSYSRFDDK